MTPTIAIQPLAVGRETAAAMCDISPRTFHARVADGTLPQPRKLGGRAVWLVSELAKACEQLPVSDLLPPPGGAD
jgi:predicted DNA-binding transcriptional regulator AlpA